MILEKQKEAMVHQEGETQANMAFREGHREWNEDLFE